MNLERELDWDENIENDSSGFVLLMEGDYPFTVQKFDRGRHKGSEKLPPCNKAVLTIEVGDKGSATTTLQHNLFLHTKTEGLLCAFFTAIGLRKHGEQMTMNWGAVVGASGMCTVEVHEYTGNDGKLHQSNRITKFLDPTDAPQQQQMSVAQATPSYTPGQF